MTALDRLVWAAWGSWTTFGVKIGVRVDDPEWLTTLREYLPPGCTPITSPTVDHLYSVRRGGTVRGSRARRYHLAYSGVMLKVRTLQDAEALDGFESTVRVDVAWSAADWTFVHAGAVGWKGQGIVLPASSTFGKSTLVEALVRAGATYYSDEFAVLDGQGRLHPFAKPLTLRRDGGGTNRIAAADLGGSTGRDHLPVRLIVSTKFEAGAVWGPRTLTPGEAAMMLLGNALRAQMAPRQILSTLARTVEGATTIESPRGEADAVAGDILRALEQRQPCDARIVTSA